MDPELEDLIARARAADGSPPFSDGALVALDGGERELVWESDETGRRVGAALDSPASSEFVIDPDARRHGHGARMLDMLTHPSRGGGPSKLFWAHGDHPGARALARHHGLVAVRELLHLEAPVPPVERSRDSGYQVSTPLDHPAWQDAWLELNARAFAAHPEQGAVTRADLDVLAAEPWFDPEDVLLLWDGDELTGYCWLKVEGGEGEFYVVGVSPDRQGQGLGRMLVQAGFARLASRGIRTAHLYVEGDNAAALALYEGVGFTRRSVDIQYRAR
jgi:mycothiol synthase